MIREFNVVFKQAFVEEGGQKESTFRIDTEKDEIVFTEGYLLVIWNKGDESRELEAYPERYILTYSNTVSE